MPTLARRPTGDMLTDRSVDRLREFVNQLGDVAILNGHHIGDTELTNAAVNKLVHKLGRPLRGYIVTDLRGATATGRLIRVRASGVATADDSRDLWFDKI